LQLLPGHDLARRNWLHPSIYQRDWHFGYAGPVFVCWTSSAIQSFRSLQLNYQRSVGQNEYTACTANGRLRDQRARVLRNAVIRPFIPQKETPSAGQTLSSAPSEVSIKYDVPIEHLFANLQVLDAAGNNMAVGQP
jgi:hypothetical protein